jgi:hypothetical protein
MRSTPLTANLGLPHKANRAPPPIDSSEANVDQTCRLFRD